MKQIPSGGASNDDFSGVSADITTAQGSQASAAPADETSLPPAVFIPLALLVVAVALAVRFFAIGRYEVWLDEAYCFSVALRPLGDILKALALDNGPPLYYFLLHYWMAAFGEGASALRALSALFSAGTVALVVSWRSPWLSRRARLLSGFLLAITPLAVYYAQEARMYSPVLFFTAAATLCLERALRLPRVLNWALCALFTLLALYTSYIAIFLVPLGYVVAVAAWAAGGDAALFKRRLVGLIATHALVALSFLPWLPAFLHQPRAQATQWIGRFQPAVSWRTPFDSLSVMTVGGVYYPRYLRELRLDPYLVDQRRKAVESGVEKSAFLRVATRIPPIVPLVLAVALSVHMFWTSFARGGGGGFPARIFLATWLVLPIVAPMVLSLLRPMYVVGRYEVTALPAFALISGIGLARFARWLKPFAVALAALLFAYSWGYALSFPHTGSEPARGARIAEMARTGDVVVAEAFEYAPIYYYAGAKRSDILFLTYPRSTIDHSAWIDYDRWLVGPAGAEIALPTLLDEARATVAEAVEKAGPGGRVIIVRSHPPAPHWAQAMEVPLVAALGEAVPARLEIDKQLTDIAMRIVVYRKVAEPSG